MNSNYLKKNRGVLLASLLLFLVFAVEINAQCTNVNMTLIRTNATCVSNGKIKVILNGSDVSNIRQSDMEFKVDGAVNRSWAVYTDQTITNLPAGSYTISMRAFCNTINDWVVFNNSVSTTLTSSYTEMDAYLGAIRKTLNCKPTGMVPIYVKANTGSSPFTITITSSPASYTGSTTFTLTRSYIGSTVVQQIDDLPAGNYTFSIVDDCSYTQTLNATVGTMDQDYAMNIFYSSPYPAKSTHSDCNVIGIYRSYTVRPADETYYYYSNLYKYYDVGFKINGEDPIIWVDPDSVKLSLFNFTIPFTIKTFRQNYLTYKLTPILRVKDTSCTFQLNDIRIQSSINMSIRYDDVGCNDATVRFYPYSYFALCYPYKWRIVKGGTVLYNWSENVYDATPQIATNVPYGSSIEYIDHDGYTWSSTLYSSPPNPTYSYTTTPCESYGRTADTIHNYFYMYFSNVDTIPVGTKFQFVSGPATPVHTDVTTTEKIRYFYPFSTDYKTSEYKYVPPGLYKFNVTLPGVGCTTQSITISHMVPFIETPFSYDTKETCGGLNIIPKGGQIAYKYGNGLISNTNTYYYIYTMNPYVSIDRGPVGIGDTLFFPTSAEYIFGMTYYQTGSCLADGDTIDYVKTQFQLNPNVTTAYVCDGGGGTGFIRVAGQGGSGSYSYELYSAGTKVATSFDGTFNYGTAGSTYTVRLIDTDPACASSYDQDVLMLDLSTAHILYTSSPTNTYCLDEDSVRLKCISLGQTTYEWSGPGITNDNKNLQNPMVAISSLGKGSYTYSITVKPEGCGQIMNQNITVVVEDCSGAHDDYLTLLVNTTDSVDVLANDAYPSNCVASVMPVITVGPTKGTATIINKKVVYTPQMDFTGKDSLTYSATCSGITTTAKVYFIVLKYPDNISDEDCYSTPEGFKWDIKQDFEGPASANHVFVTPLVGDFDGDDIPDILTVSNSINRLNIYWGKDRATTNVPTSITMTTGVDIAWSNGEAISPYAIFKTKINGVDKAIVIVNDKHNLYAYDLNGPSNQVNLHLWKTELPNNSSLRRSTVGIADFNNDGVPEVYVRNKIFNAHTGKLLVEGNVADNTGNMGYCYSVRGNEYFTIAADVIGDPRLELLAGSEVYSVDITNTDGSSGNKLTRVAKLNATFDDGVTAINDGKTIVVDINQDGKLDIVFVASSARIRKIIAWNAEDEELLFETPNFAYDNTGIPLIGNIDDNPDLEVSLIVNHRLLSYRPNSSTKKFDLAYDLAIIDRSGATGITLFDFNQDSIAEIIYRDESILRIMEAVPPTSGTVGTFRNLKTYSGGSGTWYEYPIVADVDNDGSGEIVVISGNGYVEHGSLRVYRSGNEYSWAPARKVWNQYAYNVVNVNNDLTIPVYQLNPATFFPGDDGVLGTSDDVQPYNGFLMQQTVLNKKGLPLWLVPDVYPDPSLISSSVVGDSVSITVGMINQGDAAIGSPVYVSLYKESLVAANLFATDSADIHILPGDTGYVTVRIADMNPFLPMLNIIVRVNDNGVNFTYQAECDDTNNVISILNPAVNLMMKKGAKLEGVPHNGTYPNPVSVLYNEDIEYTITAVNVNVGTGNVIIRDTLPSYLNYKSSDPIIVPVMTGTNPPRVALEWTLGGVPSMATTSVKVVATPAEGSCSSQPLYINRAWVLVSDTIYVPTNYTYHQGASVGVATFSAGLGGTIYNAHEQALDYKTSPRAGILIVPDEGYRFAGWSHDDYVSLRGETIRAKSHIMHYDTLTIYGNVNLHANFEPEEYPVRYHLNGSKPVTENPSSYTVKSGPIQLSTPEKSGDVFLGWTGSNGEIPQECVIIPEGSTGELEFYANFLYSGREDDTSVFTQKDYKIWAVENELYIETLKIGGVVRIYSVEGVLQHQQTIVHTGKTVLKLSRGIYIVTFDNHTGQKVKIE